MLSLAQYNLMNFYGFFGTLNQSLNKHKPKQLKTKIRMLTSPTQAIQQKIHTNINRKLLKLKQHPQTRTQQIVQLRSQERKLRRTFFDTQKQKIKLNNTSRFFQKDESTTPRTTQKKRLSLTCFEVDFKKDNGVVYETNKTLYKIKRMKKKLKTDESNITTVFKENQKELKQQKSVHLIGLNNQNNQKNITKKNLNFFRNKNEMLSYPSVDSPSGQKQFIFRNTKKQYRDRLQRNFSPKMLQKAFFFKEIKPEKSIPNIPKKPPPILVTHNLHKLMQSVDDQNKLQPWLIKQDHDY